MLAVTVTISDNAKPKDRLAISLANWDGTQFATDWIEYDIAFSPNTPKRHPYFSTLKGNEKKSCDVLFKKGEGVDQFGRDQSTGPGIADGKSVWEHRIVGLASTAPGPLGKHGVVFTGGKGHIRITQRVYLRIDPRPKCHAGRAARQAGRPRYPMQLHLADARQR